jgi:hypothetical protein
LSWKNVIPLRIKKRAKELPKGKTQQRIERQRQYPSYQIIDVKSQWTFKVPKRFSILITFYANIIKVFSNMQRLRNLS